MDWTKRETARALAAVVVFAISACAGGPPPAPPPVPDFQFDARPAIPLFVENVEVIQTYEPPLAPPNREHEFRISPSDMVRDWAEHRLRASGQGSALEVTILDARVVEAPMDQERPGGLFGGLRRDLKDAPNRRLNARVAVNVSYDGEYGQFTVDATASGSVDINKRASLNIVEEQYFGMLEKMAVQLDEALTRRIEESMADLILGL